MRLQLSLLVVSLCLPAVAAAQSPDPEKSAEKLITPAAQQAIDQGLKWLAGRQNADGSFGPNATRGNAAICGLCGMAFLAGGSTPGRGTYGDRVQRAVDYLLANSQPNGLLCETPLSPITPGPMYSHGFATLFLAECCGMSPRKELRAKLGLAVKLIVDTQNNEGGWRYSGANRTAGRHFGDGLPGDGAAGGAQRGYCRAQEDLRTGGRIRETIGESGWRLRLHAERTGPRLARSPAQRPPSWP